MKWEYYTLKFGVTMGGLFSGKSAAEYITKELNALGEQGWELVMLDRESLFAVFKRPIPR